MSTAKRPSSAGRRSGFGEHAPPSADVCLLVEGSYPYVAGGVARWVHDLIRSQKHLRFHLVALVADGRARSSLFRAPDNVVSLRHIVLQQAVSECPKGDDALPLMLELEAPLADLLGGGGVEAMRDVMGVLHQHREVATLAQLLNSEPAFRMAERMAETAMPHVGFVDFFWSWRALVSGLYAVMLAKLPNASVYHAISTGYAGLAMARATVATGRPGILTEHGIYTNERRVEIAMADWLHRQPPTTMSVHDRHDDLPSLWMDAFTSYARTSYDAASSIVTLFEGNQASQRRDGARPERMSIIPNGVDVKRWRAIGPSPHKRRPTVALIARVVPIKDIKTFVRAVAVLRAHMPELRALIVGPQDEDPDYARECQALAHHLGLDRTLEFLGERDVREVLPDVDVLALTSLSEAQPLVMLEAGAAGIPTVATDVGACRELIEGRRGEYPKLRAGGIVTPLADPTATARAIERLLSDQTLRKQSGLAMRERVRRYHNRKLVRMAYEELYAEQLEIADLRQAQRHSSRAA